MSEKTLAKGVVHRWEVESLDGNVVNEVMAACATKVSGWHSYDVLKIERVYPLELIEVGLYSHLDELIARAYIKHFLTLGDDSDDIVAEYEIELAEGEE